ncbi:IclR family transcriptional regulator [Streptomyces tuirus]|uniref:Glycerol operon regulatory protein n=1 Tax=Streptomyces tuirus TaxID=68278 RepID=A0A941FI10_9ACTN|nr:IclR family transcriptional regulator [Streptomyces tuirus]
MLSGRYGSGTALSRIGQLHFPAGWKGVIGSMSEADGLTNKSVVKGVQLLRELARHDSGATVTDLAKAVGLSRPTAFRLLNSLEQTGFVDRDEDSKYTLGWEFARLARRADPYSGLVARVQPVLDDLAETLRETVTLSVPTPPGRDLDLIAASKGDHVVGVSVGTLVGQKWPLHASSSGKILLAELTPEELAEFLPKRLEALTRDTIVDRDVLLRELQQVREQGYSIIDNELEEGLISLSRPVRDSAGGLVAVVTVDAPRYRFGRNRFPEALQQMQGAVVQLVELMWPGEREAVAEAAG